MTRWPTAECSRLLHYLLCFLCFLAAPTCIADGETNILLGTPLQSSSLFYLLLSSVQILWMLTEFWSLNGTPTHTDHQLSNAWLFDKSHYWGSKQQKPNLKNVKTKSPFIRMRVRIQLWLACTKSFFRESVPCPPLPSNSLVLHSLQYLTCHRHSWRDVNLCVSFLLLFNCLVLLILIHSTSITYSVFHKNFTNNYFFNTSSVQSLSRVWLFETSWTAAHQASLYIANSWTLPKIMSIVSVMPCNHLILCRPLLLLPSIFPKIRVFSNESALGIRWPKYWHFSFNIIPSNEHPGLISFRMDWLDLLAVQGTRKSLLQHYNSKASILLCSAFFIVQLSQPYMTIFQHTNILLRKCTYTLFYT